MKRSSSKKPKIASAIAPDGEPPKERGGIQSLARAFGILEEIARNCEGINLADLAKAVGLHNSTAFHLVKTMTQLGYISQVRDTKRYRVGSKLFRLAAGALEDNQLVALATPVLQTLTGETGETGHFAIRAGSDVVVLARAAGSGLLQLVDRAGSQRPAHATALGKVLISALSDAQIRQLLGGAPLQRFTAKTVVELEALIREIDEVRRNGIAYDDGEFDAEVRCVAAPVHDFAGRIAGAIGVSGPVWRLSLQLLQSTSSSVREAAKRLSTQLGFDEAHGAARPRARGAHDATR
jgi:DNA-binding IclR family transcriptional regulator